ncbi:MAG: signal peptidase II, partial [Chloroflexota bacterium]|nr:signal peptidase II [Chloroflexota bacterium]
MSPGTFPNPFSRRSAALLLILAAVVCLDQASKALVVGWIGPAADQHRFDLVSSILAIEYVENTGGAFGLLRDFGGAIVPLALLVVAVIVVVYARAHRPDVWTTFGIALLLGGAIGNLIDRVRQGFVIDFIAVGVWPRFNFADSAITLGIGLGAWRVLAVAEPDIEP